MSFGHQPWNMSKDEGDRQDHLVMRRGFNRRFHRQSGLVHAVARQLAPCERCGAKPGEWCVSSADKRSYSNVHVARIDLAITIIQLRGGVLIPPKKPSNPRNYPWAPPKNTTT